MKRREEILDFWFEGVDEAGVRGDPSCLARWFGGSEETDATIRDRFGRDVEAALSGALDGWTIEARGRLALVILLDQFTRNIHRGNAKAFSGDARARELAIDAVDRGIDRELRPIERYFLYLPFEHAEDPGLQARSVELYTRLEAEVEEGDASLFSGAVDWAVRHRVAIDRFGRFPARNAALGRESTDRELAALEEDPAGF